MDFAEIFDNLDVEFDNLKMFIEQKTSRNYQPSLMISAIFVRPRSLMWTGQKWSS